MKKTWFIYRGGLHSIEPRVDIDTEITPELLMLLVDEAMMLKHSEMIRGVSRKPFLDKKYGADPGHLPIIISEEEAQSLRKTARKEE